MIRTISILSLTLLLLASFAFSGDEDIVLGLWMTPDNDCKIEIFKCGDKYCGKIAWLKDPNYSAEDGTDLVGKPILDRFNPNPELRTHPLLGLQLMEGFTYVGKNVWEKGTIYDAEHGKTYKCKMTLASPTRLEVRGYLGIPLLGRTSVWTR